MGVYTGLYECLTTKPPLVVFTSSLVAFALALMGVSLYLESHKTHILNPDVKDWNQFYEALKHLKVCIPKHSETDKSKELNFLNQVNSSLNIEDDTTKNNITRSVLLDLHFTELKSKDFMGLSYQGHILAKHLQYKRDMNILEVSITFPKSNTKKGHPCVTFHGPQYLLPNSPKAESPEMCPIQNVTSDKIRQVEIVNPKMMEKDWCLDGTQTGILITPNRSLYVYLTKDDVTLIQLHILYTTCLLFFMMVVLGLYAICGRRCAVAKSKILPSPPDKIPLNP